MPRRPPMLAAALATVLATSGCLGATEPGEPVTVVWEVDAEVRSAPAEPQVNASVPFITVATLDGAPHAVAWTSDGPAWSVEVAPLADGSTPAPTVLGDPPSIVPLLVPDGDGTTVRLVDLLGEEVDIHDDWLAPESWDAVTDVWSCDLWCFEVVDGGETRWLRIDDGLALREDATPADSRRLAHTITVDRAAASLVRWYGDLVQWMQPLATILPATGDVDRIAASWHDGVLVVETAAADGSSTAGAEVVALDGESGTELWRMADVATCGPSELGALVLCTATDDGSGALGLTITAVSSHAGSTTWSHVESPAGAALAADPASWHRIDVDGVLTVDASGAPIHASAAIVSPIDADAALPCSAEVDGAPWWRDADELVGAVTWCDAAGEPLDDPVLEPFLVREVQQQGLVVLDDRLVAYGIRDSS